jgi:hypothetical protein
MDSPQHIPEEGAQYQLKNKINDKTPNIGDTLADNQS